MLALDYGSARCGCAVSDPTGVIATPLAPVLSPSSKKGMARLASLAEELGAERVVVGLPLTLAGRDSAQTREARDFAARLGRRLKVPLELFDERFTTVLANQDAPDARTSEDSRAAAHLLSGWLDARGKRRDTEDDG